MMHVVVCLVPMLRMCILVQLVSLYTVHNGPKAPISRTKLITLFIATIVKIKLSISTKSTTRISIMTLLLSNGCYGPVFCIATAKR